MQDAESSLVLGFSHVTFAFVYQLAKHPLARDYLQEFPWTTAVSVLQRLWDSAVGDGPSWERDERRITLGCRECNVPCGHTEQPLPEDYLMQGFPWSEDYYNCINGLEIFLAHTRQVDSRSWEEKRFQRILLLGRWIAGLDWIPLRFNDVFGFEGEDWSCGI